MPHRVVDFLRSSANTLEFQVSTFTKSGKTSRRRESPTGAARVGHGITERVAFASSEEEDSSNTTPPRSMSPLLRSNDSSDSAHTTSTASSTNTSKEVVSAKDHHHHYHHHHHKEKDHHHHRISFPGMHFGRSSKDVHANTPASLDWKLESPPIVLYNDPESSTGALVSGQIFLNIKDDHDLLDVESINATLQIHVTQKRPFTHHCHDCTHQYTELKKWQFLDHPLVLAKGQHSFPFSVLLDGHLPASMDGPLASIAYEFKAEALTKVNGTLQPVIKLEKVLDVKRSLATSEVPHHSIRVFPPTNIKANVHYPHHIHPTGTNTLQIRLDGIARLNPKVGTMEYWKLKKLTWRLEEISKSLAPACEKHAPKLPVPPSPAEGSDGQPQQPKGLPRTETRIIGEKTIFSGWKSSYSSATDSHIELELDYFISKSHASPAVCDTRWTAPGTSTSHEVSHQLMVEMVVSQEWAPVGKPNLVTHTGVGRILRMHFSSILTERGGIGISWDNEAPPIYQDVPESPPAYSELMMAGESMDGVMESDTLMLPSGLGSAAGSGRSSAVSSRRGSAEMQRR
ncbi:uncharacterized protein B0T23DRAFT_403157 [Neurospora hispaniola]|uniref:LDB19 N-terminal domain-containing protein n=1 Tax=Neurospora hispaniola TaxID=588809 RepID=A0AAJ0I8Z8_9PEZI|nr:hypothetical protein B0T23DRAFT_403157 [Neurospora hispaniola]